MNSDVEFHIRQNFPWSKLPLTVRQTVGNSQCEYEKAVVNFSVKNQLRYKGNLVKHVKKDERKYYEELMSYSKEHLMLYPYHLSDVIVKGLRVTPFNYYISMMTDIMTQEKSYDSLPNFTAADCLRLLGIGRNQYIDLMNQCRSGKKFFRRRPVRELLPSQPIPSLSLEPWWIIQAGYVTEDDIKSCALAEKELIDSIIDRGSQTAGQLNHDIVHSLYRRGLVYADVPITEDDCIVVPPLEGFVMNRVLGDYFETLLYKIFVSIDEHTTTGELANILETDFALVKNAVSMYCRLGIAKRKGHDLHVDDLHPSWQKVDSRQYGSQKSTEEKMLIDWTGVLNEDLQKEPASSPDNSSLDEAATILNHTAGGPGKRIALMFDSTLTAFLMMGNLSPGLKNHAVTMFEVGKLSDETMENFLQELEKVSDIAEGEAQRYFDHAITLRDTLRFLRYNKEVSTQDETGANGSHGHGVDLVRCESLLGLEPQSCARVLNKNYSLIISIAPLSNEIRPVTSCTPQHIGPAIAEVNSMWFRLFVYTLTGSGPPSVLLCKGTKLRRLPAVLQDYDKLLVTTWGHDPGVLATSSVLVTLNDALTHSAVLVQGHGYVNSEGETQHVAFPFSSPDSGNACSGDASSPLEQHPVVQKLANCLDLRHTCGYITLIKTGQRTPLPATSSDVTAAAGNALTSDVTRRRTGQSPPSNGLTDQASADVLASELDTLETEMTSRHHGEKPMQALRAQLSLDLGSAGPTGAQDRLAAVEEWSLLDCCYGIPLFDATLNSQVCSRIASRRLVSRESLGELLKSSRKLSLRLLDFIAENQDLPLSQLTETSALPASSASEQAVPLPTRPLVFHGGTLAPWDGH